MSDLSRTADVVVVGAGIIGAATAAALTAQGASVVVVEKEDGPAREGSGRAQGSLRVQGRHPSEFPLALDAMQLWALAVAEDTALADGAGAARVPVPELSRNGNLYLATRPEEVPLLHGLVEQARAAGLDQVHYLAADDARRIVPAATGPFLGAMWSRYDAQAQPDLATGVWVRRARRGGARFAFGVKVTSVDTVGGRVAGVTTTRGRVAAGRVVVGAGVWSGHLLAGVGVDLPVLPVVLSEVETGPVPPVITPTVRAHGFGARQRPDGRLVVSAGLGARVTRRTSLYDLHGLRHWLPRARAFRKNLRVRVDGGQLLRELRHRAVRDPRLVPDTSPEPCCDKRSVDRALSALAEVFPTASGAVGRRYWGGLVDLTPDGLPVIDHACGPDGLVVVAGLSGHGLAIGPVLGEIAADLALTGSTSYSVAPFALARFDGRVPSPEVMI